jgi:SWI/SNF chromatin-remodeling complex subunit SWI1
VIVTIMNSWANGGQANAMFPQQGTPGHLNPAQMYNNLGNVSSQQFDLSQFTAGLSNATSSAPTPPFPNQAFQQSAGVKRLHDGSPVQQGSRSQTPNYAGFPNQQGGGQQFANGPTPYSHLQPGSNNNTPSPTIQNQSFRPPAPNQRMQNASPSPYQQGNFGNQMSPQNPNQPTSVPQPNQMAGFNQQFGMNANMGMQGMPSSMPGQMNNMGGIRPQDAQKIYQMRLMQQQQRMQNTGIVGARQIGGQQSQMFNSGQQPGGQMPNGQVGGQMNMNAIQQQQMKKNQFMKTIASHVMQQGRQFNPNPTIGGRPVDLYALWTITTQAGGSQHVDRSGGWQIIATKLGFSQPQFPTAPEELKQLHALNASQYEKLWFAMRAQQKQEQGRNYAHQMATGQASPTKVMQQPNQQQQYQQFQQNQQGQPQPQVTPVQANAQLPQNGMSTPQQQMLQHRRNSSLRKPEQMTPQAAGSQAMTAPSPQSAAKALQRSPQVKTEPSVAVMKNEEPQSTNYLPAARSIELDGGYDIPGLFDLGTFIARNRPDMPAVDEMGVIDIKAITLSLASGLHAEVRYALDALSTVSYDQRVQFDLEKCQDLLEVMVDCAEDQVDVLSEEAAEVSDALDLAPYEDVMRACRAEAETLQDVSEFGTQAYDLDRAADKLIAITTIFRNFSFYEVNHRQLTSAPLIKWLSNTIRLLGTRNMLLRTFYNTQDFYKDMITFLSNITQSLELPSRDDALHILHFLLAFAPQPAPSYTERHGKVRFTSFAPTTHRYLPPAVDCLAKLLARADPNRMFFRSIFTASSSSLAISESPLDLLTRAFALSISVLPNRINRSAGSHALLRIVEARKAYLTQGMLAADILTSLMPSSETGLARAWLESEDGWAVALFNLAAMLSAEKPPPPPQKGVPPVPLGFDLETHKLITQRALAMMKRLVERAGSATATAVHTNGATTNGIGSHSSVNGEAGEDDQDDHHDTGKPSWEGIPQGQAILGACMLPFVDKTALGLLCGLHDLTMQT